MDQFWRELAPHLAANLLTVWFVYSIWLATKAEHAGNTTNRLIGYSGIIAVMLFFLGGLYS